MNHQDVPATGPSIPPRPPLPAARSVAPDAALGGLDVQHLPPHASAAAHVNRGRLGASRPVGAQIPPRPPLPARAVEPRSAAAVWLRHAVRSPRILLTAYVVVLTLIAVWPVPVDSGAGGFLRLVSRVIPVLTYARIEFGANILLFVPLGILLALILRQRYLIVPIALVATVAIESFQALLLDKRTPSVMDIIANLTGAAIGLLIVVSVEWWRDRDRSTG